MYKVRGEGTQTYSQGLVEVPTFDITSLSRPTRITVCVPSRGQGDAASLFNGISKERRP